MKNPDHCSIIGMNFKTGFSKDEWKYFDSSFFLLSPRECQSLDPQHRISLMSCWEAIENAGITQKQIAELRVGVFAGLWSGDYEHLLYENIKPLDFYHVQGTGRYALAGRISYLLNLNGPSMTVDTACSTSLVALHLACQSLINLECDVALVGAANLVFLPQLTQAYKNSKILSSHGECRFGDASGDGYARGQGCGWLVLKRTKDAGESGNRIYAEVIASVVNHDGTSGGSFGTPGILGQEDLLSRAYALAGINPNEVQYIEAHGTGTRRGDSAELTALGRVLCHNRPNTRPLYVSSIKSEIGHLEAAAGIAGVIRAINSLQRQTIYPVKNLKNPNPEIPWDVFPIQIPLKEIHFSSSDPLRYVGVNSFGISGINSHVVLSALPQRELFEVSLSKKPTSIATHALFFSTHTEQALQQRSQDLGKWLEQSLIKNNGEVEQLYLQIAEMGHTLAVGRSDLPYRGCVWASENKKLADHLTQLQNFTIGHQEESVFRQPTSRKTVWVFSGQGSQWPRMGMELAENEPGFRSHYDRLLQKFQTYLDFDFKACLSSREESALKDLPQMWPAVLHLQMALTDWFKELGFAPQAVLGHSTGEVAAAYAAGILSADHAIRLIIHQSRLLDSLRGQGGMLLLNLSVHDAREWMSPYSTEVQLAIESGPQTSVLSGSIEVLEKLKNRADQAKVFARFVATSVAVHSFQVSPLRSTFLDGLDFIEPIRGSSSIEFWSAQKGCIVEPEDLNAQYWWDTMSQSVQFAKAVKGLLFYGYNNFVEISSHPIVSVSIQETANSYPQFKIQLLTTLNKQDWQLTLSKCLRALQCAGKIGLTQLQEKTGFTSLQLAPSPKIAFILADQGPQWWEVAQELLSTEPVFRAAVEEIDRYFISLSGWSIRDELQKDEANSRINETEVAQPALFALQVGLVHLWESWGVRPHAYVGHGLGEVTAAYLTGALKLEDAVYLVYHRSRLMQQATGLGGIERCAQELSEKTSHFTYGKIHTTWASTVTGKIQKLSELESGDYWGRNILQSVHFQNAIEVLLKYEVAFMLEIGPQSILRPAIEKTMGAMGSDAIYCASLKQKYSAKETLYTAFAELWTHGYTPDWSKMYEGVDRWADLPSFPWQLEEFTLPEIAEEIQKYKTHTFESYYGWIWNEEQQKSSSELNSPEELVLWGFTSETEKLFLKYFDKPNCAIRFVSKPSVPITSDPDSDERAWISYWDDFWEGLDTCSSRYIYAYEDSKEFSNDTLSSTLLPLMTLCKTIGKKTRAINRVTLVTEQSQKVVESDNMEGYLSGWSWGLWAVARHELRDYTWASLDMEQVNREEDVRAIQDHVSGQIIEDRCAYRNGSLRFARLKKQDFNPDKTRDVLNSKGTYVITGGLGDLGWYFANQFLDSDVQSVALLSRREPSEVQKEQLKQWKAQGKKVRHYGVDLADAKRLGETIDEIQKNQGPIAGVIHAAGLIDNGVLTELSWEQWDKVFKPKVIGTINLHQALKNYGSTIEWVTQFSSIVSMLGLPGQANYAAANAFLDSIANSQQPYPIKNINWGPWQEIGMAYQNLAMQTSSQRTGIELLSSQQGWRNWQLAMSSPSIQYGIFEVDWKKYAEQFKQGKGPTFLKDFVSKIEPSGAPELLGVERPLNLVEEVKALEPTQREVFLQTAIRKEVAQILGSSEIQGIAMNRGFKDLGFDSLMTMELRNRLQNIFELKLSSTLVFDYPNINSISAFIFEKLNFDNREKVSSGQDQADKKDTANKSNRLTSSEIKARLAEKVSTHRIKKEEDSNGK